MAFFTKPVNTFFVYFLRSLCYDIYINKLRENIFLFLGNFLFSKTLGLPR